MHALTLVSFAVVVGQAIALSPRVPIEALLAKRADVAGVSDSDIPSQCSSECSALVNSLSCTVSDISCVCNEQVNQGIVTCYECIVNLAPTNQTLFSQAQSQLSQYESACDQAQKTVASLTLATPTASATAGNGASGLFVSTVAVGGAVSAALAALVF